LFSRIVTITFIVAAANNRVCPLEHTLALCFHHGAGPKLSRKSRDLPPGP